MTRRTYLLQVLRRDEYGGDVIVLEVTSWYLCCRLIYRGASISTMLEIRKLGNSSVKFWIIRFRSMGLKGRPIQVNIDALSNIDW